MATTDLEQSIPDKHTTEVNSQANELGGFFGWGFLFIFIYIFTSVYCSTQHFNFQIPELNFSEKGQINSGS